MKKLLIIAIPILEILLFVEIGSLIGVFGTLSIIILTAILGFIIIRNSGVNNLFNPTNILKSQNLALNNLFRALCYIFSGIFLIIPGYITDLIGLLLLVAFIRNLIIFLPFMKIFVNKFAGDNPQENGYENQTIEGEYNEINQNNKEN